MTSYILQFQNYGDPRPAPIGVYSSQDDAISKRDELVTRDVGLFETDNPQSTFITVTSNDNLVVFIIKNDTTSYPCSFDQTQYQEVMCSMSIQTLTRTYGVSQLVNP